MRNQRKWHCIQFGCDNKNINQFMLFSSLLNTIFIHLDLKIFVCQLDCKTVLSFITILSFDYVSVMFQLYIEDTEDYLWSLNFKFDTPLRGKAITYQTNGFLSIVLEFLNIIRDC